MLHTTGGDAGNDEDSASSPRLALRLSAMEATQWCRLGFQVEDNSQDQRGAEQIRKSTTLLIAQVAWTSPA